MKIDTHGLKMIGLRKAAGYTENYSRDSGKYVQVSYDKATGEVLTTYHVSLGNNSWTEYNDANVILVCFTRHHLRMQTIAELIAAKVAYNTSKQWKIC